MSTSGKTVTEERKKIIYKRYKEGVAQKDIAAVLNLTTRTVNIIVKKMKEKDHGTN